MKIINFWAPKHLMSHQIKPKGFVHAAGGSNSAGGLGSVTSPARVIGSALLRKKEAKPRKLW